MSNNIPIKGILEINKRIKLPYSLEKDIEGWRVLFLGGVCGEITQVVEGVYYIEQTDRYFNDLLNAAESVILCCVIENYFNAE